MQAKMYRKKVLTEAMYVDPSEAGVSALREWGAEVSVEDGKLLLRTLEGKIPMHLDGVVCRGPAGDYYCSAHDIFETNYVEV